MRGMLVNRLLAWVGLLALAPLSGTLACGGGGGGGSDAGGGGHCISSMWCWEVTDPPNYRIDQMCGLSGSTWQSGPCDPSGYERRCTQDTSVSMNGGPEMTVRYVYYYPPGSTFACAGQEEILN